MEKTCDQLSELMLAVLRRDIVAVKKLAPIQAGYQLKRDQAGIVAGATALIVAVTSGFSSAIQHLRVEQGLRDSQGNTALLYAAEREDANTVRLLAHKEGEIMDCAGKTALMRAAIFNRPDSIRQLLFLSGCKDSRGQTALMMAAKLGCTDAIQELKHYECGFLDCGGKTAFDYADMEGREVIASDSFAMQREARAMKLVRSLEEAYGGQIEDDAFQTQIARHEEDLLLELQLRLPSM